MVRKHFLLDQEQIDFLENLHGPISGHVRRAIDDYIYKIKKEGTPNVSASQSKKGI